MTKHVRPLILLALLWAGVAQAEKPEGFIKTWLLCGPFPNPPNKPAVPGEEHIYDHTPPCVGLDTDYLAQHGGEAKIVPHAGMTHTKKDGTKVKWFEYTSDLDKVVFRKAIARTPNHVAYAFATVQVAEPGPCLLALGSDDGVRVWVNGEQVHYKLLKRPIREDDDLVPVTLKKGENRILVKVEQGWGGWGFILRLAPRDEVFSTVRTDVHRQKVTVSLRRRETEKRRKVVLLSAGKKVTEGLIEDPTGIGLASGTIEMPFPPPGSELGNLEIVVDGRSSGHVAVPSLGKARNEAFKWLTPIGSPGCVFAGEEFPRLDFERPFWVERLIGPYSISATYYDADYNEVESAEKPGRYGAVVDVKTADRTTRRFVTLFRQPEDFNWWRVKLDGDAMLPGELGVPPDVAKDYANSINGFVKGRIRDGMREPGGAILLSALHEAQADGIKADYYGEPEMRDRAWWLPLKRKLYGVDKKYGPFVCPRKIDGPTAGIVRKGSWREAGMKRGFARKLHSYLETWEDDTDEAFAVIVVRHGVIAFHRAYGTRHGKRMTLETKSWMASTTKMMSGTLMMMLVDQGLLSLDDRADKYLPPLRDVAKEWPATIRNLYRHTAGMSGHWGSWFSDMEYRVADMAPYYEFRKRYEYDGAGLDLSCKILELMSGETLPEFFRNHLLGPLGCEDTNVDDAAGGANSIPLDMARICQMLLQKGAYGDMRFFSESAFEQMLPKPFEEGMPNVPWGGYQGIGTGFFHGEGLGEGTFAHGAASGAFTRIDPVNDMVIVMTRNSRGENFSKYDKGFFEIIVDGLEKEMREEAH